MGKKSLLSSTSIKRGDSESSRVKEKKSKATAGSTKKVSKAAPRKKTPAKAATDSKKKVSQTAMKKSASAGAAVKKSTAPKKKAAPKRVKTAKTGNETKTRKSVAKKKPVSVKELLSKRFEISVPEKQYTPPESSGRRTDVLSPPFVTGATPEETERIRQLLFKKFDAVSHETETYPAQEKSSGDISQSTVTTPGQNGENNESVYPSMELNETTPAKKLDSMQKSVLFVILGLIVLLCLIVGESMSNSAKYYLKPVGGDLIILKGNFSPMGKKEFVTLSAALMTTQPKEVYSKKEIFPFIFESYVNQADALLDASDIPDFELIRSTLNTALAFSVSPEQSERIRRRLSKINLMALVYKADILAGKNTAADLTSARSALEKAVRLDLDEAEKGLVEQKLQWIDERQAQLE